VVGLKIIEEVIEVGQPLPEAMAPSDRHWADYGPCVCGRVHRPRIVHIED
jgi:hypothetical protein